MTRSRYISQQGRRPAITTHDVLCRPCQVQFIVVSEETGDAKCPTCGVWFEGGVLKSFLDYEHRKVVSEEIAEIRTLPSGKKTVILRRNLIKHLQNCILIRAVSGARLDASAPGSLQ
ncbi:MAG: hypothetical protein OXE96_12685 [Gemmatimonadetes bacterium]|nr:hypothetical protein [Gemmatimonadota bacterium]